MAYDPTLPAANSPNSSAQMRAQFNGLKALIDAVPAINAAVVDGVSTVNPGDPAVVTLSVAGGTLHFTFGIPRGQDGSNGSDGAPGTPVTSFVVDGVSTLNPTDPATVLASFDGTSVRFAFGIPRGQDGQAGQNGSNGNDGSQGPPFTSFLVDGVNTLNPGDPATVAANFDGSFVRLLFGIPRGQEGQAGPQGPQGQPFGNFLVDSVTTLNPGDPATVQATFDGSNVRFQFGIPRGQNGNDGGMGAQGPPGEVSTMQLNNAINGTSNNSNAVATLGMTVSDPPTQGEMQAIASKVDELIAELRR